MNIEYRTPNVECRSGLAPWFESPLRSQVGFSDRLLATTLSSRGTRDLFKQHRAAIPSFSVHYSVFDIRHSKKQWKAYLSQILLLTVIVLPASADDPNTPFFNLRSHQTEYHGPADDMPTDINCIRIGYFGPNDINHPEYGGMWCAASLAIEQANAAGGYKGTPFELVPRWSSTPWGTGVRDLARLAYDDRVWAIVGGMDGASTHLAEQIVAKAHLPLVCPASTDKTLNLANVPWMFSCVPQDHLIAPILAGAIAKARTSGPLVLISSVEHDSHLFADELKKALMKKRCPVDYAYTYAGKPGDRQALVRQVITLKPQSVVLSVRASVSAELCQDLRSHGFKGTLYGGPWMGQRLFRAKAGRAAQDVVFPLLFRSSARSTGFEKQFTKRGGYAPDYLCAYAFDAVTLLVKAIREVGLNRVEIRQSIARGTFEGVTGPFVWDGLGSNTRVAVLGTLCTDTETGYPISNAEMQRLNIQYPTRNFQ